MANVRTQRNARSLRGRGLGVLSTLLTLLTFGAGGAGCDSAPEPLSAARQVKNRSDLVGGVRALGDLGDFLIENDKVRVVIQGPGFSRGFGVYGGSLIDADLRRPDDKGTDHRKGTGLDTFGELFPAFFLQAVAVDEVFIDADGSDGGAARIIARGKSGDFLELAGVLNQAVVGSLDSDLLAQVINAQQRADFLKRKSLQFDNIYELEPGASHVKITLRVTNIAEDRIQFPGKLAQNVLPLLGIPASQISDFTVPLGDVALYGAVSKIFLPGIGFDLRFGLDAAYARGIGLPSFPGVVTDWVASRGDGTSYGLTVKANEERNYAWVKRDIYGADGSVVTPSSLLLPFVAGGFIGVFYENAPPALEPGESFEFTRYFVIGSGDVGSVLDEINQIHSVATGKFGGYVYEAVGGQPAAGVNVLVYQRRDDGTLRIYSQYDSQDSGQFGGDLAAGKYSVRTQGPGRPLGDLVEFEVVAGKAVSLQLTAQSAGRVVVNLYTDDGAPSPGKASAVGSYDPEFSGQVTREFLFDLQAGDEYRNSDLVKDEPGRPDTRRYIEEVGYAKNGVAEILVRPGTYQIYSSRGPEFDVERSTVKVEAGQTVSVAHKLRRVVDTTGFIAADTHIHSINSIDSAIDLDTRVLAIAGEGIEWGVATDHNFVTDLGPVVQRNGLENHLLTSVGLELTTLESGHFNGFPLDYQVGAIGHGSFEWARRAPDELFTELRSLSRLGAEETAVQVNHPRDSIIGYFGQYQRDALTLDEIVDTSLTAAFTQLSGPAFVDEGGQSTFSYAFDLFEALNGKLFWEIHHYRVPKNLPEGELPAEVPPTGTIVLDADGQPAFPGAVDDWYTLLNKGERKMAVGTSDSHSLEDEVGYFRTMVFVGEDRPGHLTEGQMVGALRKGRAVATNGPMLELYVNDPAKGFMGSDLVDTDGTVTVGYRLSAAPWIGMSHINIVRNGVIAAVIDVAPGRDLAANPLVGTMEVPMARDENDQPIDAWFVLEAIGSDSMFPVIRPNELPPLLLDDALASLAGPLGFGTAEFGALRPAEIFPVVGHAMSNPVWVATEAGRPWQAPGPVPVVELNTPENDSGLNSNPVIKSRLGMEAGIGTDMRYLEKVVNRRIAQRVKPLRYKVTPAFNRNKDNETDVRRLFSAFGHLFH